MKLSRAPRIFFLFILVWLVLFFFTVTTPHHLSLSRPAQAPPSPNPVSERATTAATAPQVALVSGSTSTSPLPKSDAASYPAFPLDVLNETGFPLAELRLCRERNRKLSCVGNPTCLLPTCSHSNPGKLMGNFSFARNQQVVAHYFASRPARRALILRLLSDWTAHTGRSHNNSVALVTFNNGYGYLFANWYCSLLAARIDLDRLKSHLLVIATDTGARKLASSLGFFTFDPSALFAWTGRRIETAAASGFARGSHALINLSVKYGLVADLVSMGVDATVMDTDFIWTGEALQILDEACEATRCDGMFIKDGRPFLPAVIVQYSPAPRTDPAPLFQDVDRSNPYPQYNTGFFKIRSNAATHKFMTTLMHASFLQQWKGTDQLIFNMLMWHVSVPRLNWGHLPERRFVPGGSLHVGKVLSPFPRPPELVVVHPSDAERHTTKITKLGKLGLWFLNNVTCPAVLDACTLIAGCLPHPRSAFLEAVFAVKPDGFLGAPERALAAAAAAAA